MPGFTSFLLGHPPFKSLKPDSPPPSNSDSEPEPVRAAMRRAEKINARKVTTLHGTVLTRPAVERSHVAMLNLQAELNDQIERFHNAGLATRKERKDLLKEFEEWNNIILRTGGEVLRKLDVSTGPVEDLEEGLRVLGRLVGEHHDGKMGLEDAEKVFKVIRNAVGKPLGEMCGVFGRALGDKGAWERG
ncbi:hypothetical protein CC86DRAFT_402206 [Ophiobolus disseminans]|uniref:Uncharacterized protein n=1 Tax=Ophiobolus disseminans TaxID=1469910 RepID=A0A6A7AEG0_9PLEO|nr:hypothetical protein CC86DRAFT_402206 [Ophiobolus disseminans]